MSTKFNTTPTFHESFGEIPKGLLTTIQRSNVSPADFYGLEAQGFVGREMAEFISSHTDHGMYRAPWPLPHASEWLG